jgi:hypothetical protein
VLLIAAAFVPALTLRADDKQEWGTVKGQVFFNGGNIPAMKNIVVPAPAPACVAGNPPIEEKWVINPKNKGVRWAIVSLGPLEKKGKLPIHPDLAAIPNKAVEIDQPCCAFTPRVVAMRGGQALTIKNSAGFLHNANFAGAVKAKNDAFNTAIAAGGKHVTAPLNPYWVPMSLSCTVHSWMKAHVAVFDHPYFAVTDADGNFEIPKAPAGKYRIRVWQESIGFRGGEDGVLGELLEIKKDGITELKLDLK